MDLQTPLTLPHVALTAVGIWLSRQQSLVSFFVSNTDGDPFLGLDVLGAIAASVQLVQVIQTSLKFLNSARKTSKHAAEQRDMEFHLVVQAIKFEGWCAILNISDIIRVKEADPVNWQRSREFTDFRRVLGSNLRFDNGGIAELTISILVGLTEKFEAAWRILETHDSPSEDSLKMDVNLAQKRPKKWYSSLAKKKKDPQHSETDSTGHKKIYNAIKWVGCDKKEFSTLLSQIGELNSSLLTLLDMERQQRVQRQVLMRILDSSEAQSMSSPELDSNTELTRLINLKTLLQAKNQEDSSTFAAPRSHHVRIYSLVDFQAEILTLRDERSVYQHGAETVLIEWKYYNDEKPGLQGTTRLIKLVELLNYDGLSERFLAPKCRGLVEDSFRSRIGLVFSTTLKVAQPGIAIQYRNLQHFIMSSVETPSVTHRILMARNLATAISNLHSVQWLHKSIRSDNFVFFEDPEREAAHELSRNETSKSISKTTSNSTTGERLSHAPPSLPALYVLGWDLSRPDNPLELSQSRPRPSDEYVENMVLYCHPEAHPYIMNAKNSRYRVQFDIYSLGLVLLEVGLWRTLSGLRRKCLNDEDFRRKLQGEYCDKLQSKMGMIYWRATQRCIANDFDLQGAGAEDTKNLPLQSAFEQQVVSELARCTI